MSFFQEFSKLHIRVKSFVLTIIAIFPFYFVALYLFQNDLFKDYFGKSFYLNDFKIIFIFSLCFAFSLIWVMANVFLSLGIQYYTEKMLQEEFEIEFSFILTFFYSIFYLSLSILINYFIFDLSLINFFLLSNLILVARFLWTYFGYRFVKKDM